MMHWKNKKANSGYLSIFPQILLPPTFRSLGHCSNYKLQCQASDLRLRLVVNDDDDYEYYDDADENNDMEMGW